jgi:hypothetical protein
MPQDNKIKEEELDSTKEKDDSRLFIGIGIALSILWICVVVYLWNKTTLPDNWSLNQLGDFLAGVTAPLALLWFILGFFLQIKEIRYQRIEITGLKTHSRRTADAQEAGVELQRQEMEIGDKPLLLYLNSTTSNTGSAGSIYQVMFENQGATAHNFNFTTEEPNIKISYYPKDPINQTSRGQLRFHFDTTNNLPQKFVLTYSDLKGNEYQHVGNLGGSDTENRIFFNNSNFTPSAIASMIIKQK